MASIILSTAGSAIGAATGLPAGGILGRGIGRALGGLVDDRLFSRSTTRLKDREGPRLADLAVQTSTYGKMIPIVYGTARIAGNIIWARPIKETVVTTTSTASTGGGGGKGGGGKVTQTSTSYSYSVSLAIALCEGPVTEVLRMWADAKQLDMSKFTLRIYKGTATQGADTYISSVQGAANTPAYRGLAYVVIEDFPLADYGNRIPNFTFEVRKKAQKPDYEGEILEDMIGGVTLIPGAGEFVYDTQVEYKVPGVQTASGLVQKGSREPINMHNASGRANALLALNQLAETCPNVEWVSVVVSWFGTSLDAGDCVIKPGVEYKVGATTSPDTWQVAGYSRASAHLIAQDGGSPRYGGTPDDGSVLRLLANLRARGYKIMFYPMLFMDVAGKPWRGMLTGTASEVTNFFPKTYGYDAFIMHYANLVHDKVDAFVIGSELKGLTAVTDAPGSYPAVARLVNLADAVKTVLDADVKVTYAADWSEYHHTDGGWYHMDPLWASDSIDMIGIDAYFPLSDAPQNGYDVQALIDGWDTGEGYDWYYADSARTVQAPLGAAYAWKNIEWFWNNGHTNPNGAATGWVPQSKKIWFTEYGFPSVDGAANQPNVFYDPATSGSAFPYYSKGRVDFRAQRAGLIATQARWKDSPVVEQMFVWAWDARPYPYWPDLTRVWTDGAAWKTGHWIQGKLGISSLASIVSDVCLRAGLEEEDFDTSQITDQVEGFVIAGQQSLRGTVEQLAQAYFFDAAESDGVLKFIPRGGSPVVSIGQDEIVPAKGDRQEKLLAITRQQEIELPKRVNVLYLNRLNNYQTATQYAQRESTESRQTLTLDLPLVFSDQAAKTVADVALYAGWTARNAYRVHLPPKFLVLEPADVIEVTVNGVVHRMRVTATGFAAPGILRVDAVAEDAAAYDFYTAPGDVPAGTAEAEPVAATVLEILDIPALPGDTPAGGMLRFAAAGDTTNWSGSVIYRSDDGGESYERLVDVTTPAAMGTATTALGSGTTAVFDETSSVTVALLGAGELASASESAVLNGANAALLGNEIIQFRNAALESPGIYTLTGLLRGRAGTAWAMASHEEGERFVLLNNLLARQGMPASLIGLSRPYKPVSVGSTLTETDATHFTYSAVCLKPYAPVSISAVRDGSGNITLSWVRCTRISGEWQDFVDVPLNEEREAYEVEILDGVGVVRTIRGLAVPEAGYSAAQQIADFGSEQASVSVRVYQLSALVGRGYAGEALV